MSTWPSNSAITLDALDSDSDVVTGASGGRAQLEDVAQAVNSILAACATGSTPWTDANDGAGSGLDADTVDGKQAAALGALAVAAEWTAQQNFNAATLTYASPNTDWNLNTHQVGILNLAGSITMNAPTNIKQGGVYILIVNNQGSGYDITWNSAYKWEGGVTPTVTSGSGKVDVFTFVANTTSTLVGVARQDFS